MAFSSSKSSYTQSAPVFAIKIWLRADSSVAAGWAVIPACPVSFVLLKINSAEGWSAGVCYTPLSQVFAVAMC